MKSILLITNALAEESRLRIVAGLRQGDLCVCQIAELLGLAQSTVSKHMFILKTAGLVESRREGKWIYYLRPQKELSPAVQKVLRWVDSVTDDDRQIAADSRIIQTMIREGLCSFPDRRVIARSQADKEAL